MTLTPRELRTAVARRKVELTLARAHPDLTDTAFEYLVAEAVKSPLFESHVVTGEVLDLHEITDSARRSEVGQLIFADEDDADAGPVDHAKATESMTPQQRLSYARENGLR